MFWEKFDALCKKEGKTASAIAKELGVTSAAITGWKKGAIPSGEALTKIAEHFGTTIEYLISDDEIYIKPSAKKDAFLTMMSLPQRWSSLRHGEIQTTDEIMKISKYMNCSVPYLYSNMKSYTPAGERSTESLLDVNTFYMILGIMDRCPDTSDLKHLQEQISRIVLYWTDKYLKEEQSLIKSHKFIELRTAKLTYLYTGVITLDPTFEYGLNFTEIDVIREKTGMPLHYMFTGVMESPAELVAAEKDRKIAELEAKIANFESKV